MQKMKITIPVIIIIVLALIGGAYYIFSNRIEVDKQGGITLKKDDIVTQETSYEKDGNLFRFTKNRITKTASFDMVYNLADKDEFSDFMGTKITTVPFLVNFLCGTLNQAFFDPEALKAAIASNSADTTKATNITDDNQFKNALAGYKVSEFSLDFKDKAGQIATCQSTQKGFENIKFTVVRDFSSYDSFLGQKIGVVK
jgi:hypothetical protein